MNIKRFFYRQFYVSDVTKFLNQLHADNPQLYQQQLKGRALLWDKTDLNLEQQRQAKQASLVQNGYVYQTKPKTENLLD